MNNIENYFNSPLFESSKSIYAVRYQNESEYKLLKKLDADPRVRFYFQPILTALVKYSDKEFFINIDFWVELISGKVELLYLSTEVEIPEEAEIILFTNPSERLKTGNFGFITVRENKFQRVTSRNLKLNIDFSVIDSCLVNFNWIN